MPYPSPVDTSLEERTVDETKNFSRIPNDAILEVLPSINYSKILPYSPESGDPYYIGDIYEDTPLSITQEWETDISNAPYLAFIKSISSVWPSLRYLGDFMEVGTTPLRWKFLRDNEAERRERSQRTKVAVLDFFASGKSNHRTFTNPDDLEDALCSSSGDHSTKVPFRLVIVEDLSFRVIEILGANLDIDPTFFREFIDDYSWYNIRDRSVNLPNLKIGTRHQSWSKVRFVRPRYFRTRDSYQRAREESNRFNVLRRPDDDQNQWTFTDKEAIIGLTRTKALIWTGKSSHRDCENIGVILVDPTVREGYQLWRGYGNWAPIPSMHSKDVLPAAPPRTSLFDDLIYWTLKYPWNSSLSYETSPRYLGILRQPILHIVCAEWINMVEYIKTRIGQIEWELGYPVQFQTDLDKIEISLKRLHTWRRLIPLYQDMLSETIEGVTQSVSTLQSHGISNITNNGAETGSCFGTPYDTNLDLETSLNGLKALQDRTDRLTSVIVAIISIEESRQGFRESRNLARLTWLATIFIPLSFLTGFFSMQTDITALSNTFTWYFVAAVPVTVLTLAFATNMNIRHWLKERRDRKEKQNVPKNGRTSL